jgi:invasion protein IalB
MNKFVITAALASVIGFCANPSSAKEADAQAADQGEMMQQQMPIPMIKRDHLFEERAGTWKATCDEMEDSKVYCRMFHIEQFGEWKTKNFVQVGPAWTPEAVGFVVATYLGFKEGTTVSIGIDKHSRHEVTAPKSNNLMIRPEITEKILQQMENGHKIVITFNSYSGVRHLTLADLGPFKTLLAKVKMQMARNSQLEIAE